MGIAKVGGIGANGSGDIFLALSTANPSAASLESAEGLEILANEQIDLVLLATVERAILNAMVASRTMVGINGNTLYGLPHERVREVLEKYGR